MCFSADFFFYISINLNTYNSVNLLYNFPTNYGYFCEFQYGKFPHIKPADYSMLVGILFFLFFLQCNKLPPKVS